jgi:predicted NBD/HSP70 family sugar kinase
MRCPKVLVVDIGGTHVKMYSSEHRTRVRIDSGPWMTPARMVNDIRHAVDGWQYDVVSLGYPGPVMRGKPLREPAHLGRGWVRFDFRKGFGRPVRIVNDAAMQALGSYRGGRMLFLGLGTGLGTAMIVDDTLLAMELAHAVQERRFVRRSRRRGGPLQERPQEVEESGRRCDRTAEGRSASRLRGGRRR